MKTFMIILLVIVAVFLVWYIVSFKGVNKDKARIIEQQINLKVGSNVVLSSGIHGKVLKVNKETVEIIIDKTKNITMTVERYCVSKVL
ncbi:preprotein translocase subunit YajC [Clostridium perfringens]|uniref:preprotein translocase subunit YajC n=2 Tax=Clostridium perfringens TaxID=1502 RepID=UPI000B392A1A|nr:preprotein translocase subunit YajC [Clostridium perfringens]EHK2400955.1 preprotein translocase subunit YajC [Clostridium perfringens]MBO3329732.1 preprotein translocase subunit YajC [Clostridium perfringens]MDU4074964.1 preprotein translocase subunit YajC [Clostridium perfringens]MDU4133297.1 preprotein translocase subunit YajC [Clostridium perfringens]OUN51614.1 preprotein translocase subunit YajC [Clostridium perfringens]